MQTFLFTDIESSTRLWEEQPEEAEPVDLVIAASAELSSLAVLPYDSDQTGLPRSPISPPNG